jgi:enoyl-[acyl-carrier-protein] reductase (NADH)
LAPRDRSLVTVSALIATGQVAQISYHLNRAMDNGLSKEEAGEVVGHLAFCVGWPNAFSAALTKATALDYAAQNIRVNAVCPGIIDTPMMQRFTGGTPEGVARVIAQEPIGRMGRPEEIAAAVLWLCSDSAAFVVGHAMVIDGGQTV